MAYKVGHLETFKRRFTQEDFNRFAGLSGDNNPIHVDSELSARTYFGKTVAHGMLLYGTICRVLSTQYPGPGVLQIKQKMMFQNPTYTVTEITVKFEVIDVKLDEQRAEIRTVVSLPDGKPACDGSTMIHLPGWKGGFPGIDESMAAAKLGLILVPLNWRLTATELAFILNDSRAETLLFDTNLAELVEGVREKTALKHYIVIGGQDPSNAYGYETRLSAQPDGEPTPEVIPDLNTPHIIMYTAGTNGQPKGAILSQGGSFWNVLNLNLPMDFTSKDRNLVVLPMFHIGGIGLFTLPMLYDGGTVVIQRTFDPVQTLTLLKQENITLFFGVPAIFLALIQHPDFDAAAFNHTPKKGGLK